VGGGSAGWLTAGIIGAKHSPAASGVGGTRIILLESPDVPNLGVGEGTWPTMRDTLRRIGVSEADFLRCSDASFKQGTQFRGWSRGGDESYYHPFSAPSGYPTLNVAAHWQALQTKPSFGDAVCPQGRVCDRGLAPKKPQTPEYAFDLNYGYHLNAGKFVELLQRHCVENLGVDHKLGHVERIIAAENDDIAALQLTSGATIAGDIFIDCTGFSALLIGKHYGIPFVSQQHVLFNDTALAVQADYSAEDAPIASCTRSTARSYGWIWDIALPTRRGIGYAFSRQHGSLEKAEAELADYLSADPWLAKVQRSPRKIEYQPGYRETFWHRNCVAVGVSAGFVEPLEASALVIIERSAEWIAEQLPRDSAAMPVVAKRFNEVTRQHWHAIIDFLKLHYVLTKRSDSDYWLDHRRSESVTESLQESLLLWRTQVPWLYESNQRVELFSSASVQYVLYGMNFVTDVPEARYRHWARDAKIANRLFEENRMTAESMLASLPTNRELLERVRRKENPTMRLRSTQE
jgi:hypothetical protein